MRGCPTRDCMFSQAQKTASMTVSVSKCRNTVLFYLRFWTSHNSGSLFFPYQTGKRAVPDKAKRRSHSTAATHVRSPLRAHALRRRRPIPRRPPRRAITPATGASPRDRYPRCLPSPSPRPLTKVGEIVDRRGRDAHSLTRRSPQASRSTAADAMDLEELALRREEYYGARASEREIRSDDKRTNRTMCMYLCEFSLARGQRVAPRAAE